MSRQPTEEERIRAAAHVVGLLNEAEGVLTGWVLKHDREKIKKLLDPVYDLVDKE